MFAGLLVVSYQYMYFTVVVRWTPTFRDILIPFLLGATEFIPMHLLQPDNTATWWFAFAGFALAGAIAYLNTVRRFTHFKWVTKRPLGHAEEQLQRLLRSLCGLSFAAAVGCVGVGFAILRQPDLAPVMVPIAGGAVVVVVVGGMVFHSERALDAIHQHFDVPRYTVFRYLPGWPASRRHRRDAPSP